MLLLNSPAEYLQQYFLYILLYIHFPGKDQPHLEVL